MPFAVCVTFSLRPKSVEDFLPLMHANAQTSLLQEQGCLRFDVLTDPSRPTDVFLYELYDDSTAFQAHLDSAHFRSFDRAVADMIATKQVQTYEKVIS